MYGPHFGPPPPHGFYGPHGPPMHHGPYGYGHHRPGEPVVCCCTII